jgi:Hypervirulence associated proteins TUDOR domain
VSTTFHIGEHVRWNSEAGLVRGVIVRAFTSNTRWKDYLRHASKAEPQYVIKSDTTDHMAVHKGTALRRVPSRRSTKPTGGTLTRSKREKRLPR